MSIVYQSLISTNANTNPEKKPPIIDKNYFTHKENFKFCIKRDEKKDQKKDSKINFKRFQS